MAVRLTFLRAAQLSASWLYPLLLILSASGSPTLVKKARFVVSQTYDLAIAAHPNPNLAKNTTMNTSYIWVRFGTIGAARREGQKPLRTWVYKTGLL